MKKTNETAHFEVVKQQNKKVIRNLLRYETALSIPQITKMTGLTYPTCAGILKELLEDNQVVKDSEPTSKGGRPSVNYKLNETYKYGLVMYFDEWNLKGAVYDCKGISIHNFKWSVTKDIRVSDILDRIAEVKTNYQSLDSVIIGIPGVVSGGEIVFLPKFPNLMKQEIKKKIEQSAKINVLLENDLNAMAYAKAQTGGNYAMIAYINKCVGAGIVLDGKIHVGSRGFAGELESLCTDISNEEQTIAQCIYILMCVLDLPSFYILGDSCNGEALQQVHEILENKFKVNQVPQLILENDMEVCYEQGLVRRIIEEWERTIS